MITLKEFKELPFGEVFSTGILPNSPEGIFMTNTGGNLRWVAKKGEINDWVVYCHWEDKTVEWIAQHGDKVQNTENIKRCVQCEDDVLKLYRH
jgi:hypothetical protein